MRGIHVSRNSLPGSALLALLSLGLAAAIGLSGCKNPLSSREERSSVETSSGTGSIRVSAGSQLSGVSRTIIPDFGSMLSAIRVRATPTSGGQSFESDANAKNRWTASFTGIEAGTWDLTASALSTVGGVETEIGSGSEMNVVVQQGQSTSVTIPIAFSHGASIGTLAIKVSWPQNSGAGYLEWILDGAPMGGITALPDPDLPDNYAVTLRAERGPGNYLTELRFKKGDTNDPIVADICEAVNIVSGMESNSWIDSSGTVRSAMILAASDFFSSDANLGSLSFSNATVRDMLNLSAKDPKLLFSEDREISGSFTFTAGASAAGQAISYTWCGEAKTWSAVSQNGTSRTSEDLDIKAGGDNRLVITITAPDRTTKNTYSFIYPFISSSGGLAAMRDRLDGHYTLMDVVSLNTWEPVGSVDDPFIGSLKGNGKSINIGTISGSDYVGLFGVIGAEGEVDQVTLNMTNPITATGSFVGALAGLNRGSITNSTTGATITVTAVAGSAIGGLVGQNNGTISSSYYAGTLTANTGSMVGGITGFNQGSVSNCINWGVVKGKEEVGGIVGNNDGGTIKSCYSTGDIAGQSNVGGLVGSCGRQARVDICYAVGEVDGDQFVGGLIGFMDLSEATNCYSRGKVMGSQYVGGLIGHTIDSTTRSSYSTGTVPAFGSDIGSFVGLAFNSAFNYCYAKESQTVPNIPQVISYYDLPLGFDNSIWVASFMENMNNGYPYLRNLSTPPALP
jgi:hypothetical protein